MAINKKLIHFGAKANFEKELAAGNILDTSIVFIKDAKLIWTHGQYYGSESISSEIEDRLNNLEIVIEDNELTTANALIELKKTKADLSDSLSGYGILDAYTKEEIDNKNFYTKPSTGISITDLEESIRTSLENADSYKGTVTGVKLNGTTNIPSEDGTVDLGTIKLNLDSSYIPAVYPEDTGDGEFAELTPGESLDSAIKKLDQNLVNVVGEILDNEEVMAQALTDLNDSKTTLEEVESIYLRKENLPSSLKNPYGLTIKKNSTTLADYDGSSSKVVNLSFNSGEISIDYNYNAVDYGGNISFGSISPGETLSTSLNTIENNISGLAGKVADNEEVISAALTDLNDRKADRDEVNNLYLKKEDLPESIKNPEPLTIKANDVTFGVYDGSEAKTINITAENLGLSSVLKYCGITTTPLTDNSTTNPIKISDSDYIANSGDVVFFEDKEFIFNGESWEEFGYSVNLSSYATTLWVENNYKPKQDVVNDPSVEGNSLSFIDTISQNVNGEITVTKKNVDFSEYLKKSELEDTDDITLPQNFTPSEYPENIDNTEFSELVAGEILSDTIQKLDRNISNLAQDVVENKTAVSEALSKINEKLDSEKIISDDPQPTGFSLGGNTVYKKLISLEYTNIGEETEWILPCSTDTTGVNLIDMSLIITQQVDGFDGSISFDYRDYYFIYKNSNQIIYFYDHNDGNIVLRFKSSKQTNLLGTITFSTSSVVSGGDSADITNEDLIEGGTSI